MKSKVNLNKWILNEEPGLSNLELKLPHYNMHNLYRHYV
jgi:hypothetical protein